MRGESAVMPNLRMAVSGGDSLGDEEEEDKDDVRWCAMAQQSSRPA